MITKNSVMRKAIQMKIKPETADECFAEHVGEAKPQLDVVLPLLEDKLAFIFTNESIAELKPKIEVNRVPAAAKIGAFAQREVILPPGPTGMDPS